MLEVIHTPTLTSILGFSFFYWCIMNIELTPKRLKELLKYDTSTGRFESIDPKKKFTESYNDQGYLTLKIDNKVYRSHRLAWLYVHEKYPLGMIDHINGIRDDNRLINLRDVTRSENLQNQKKSSKGSSSIYLGVSWCKAKNKWVSQIALNKKVKHLGYFDDDKMAHEAYLTAKRILHSAGTI